MNPQPTARRLVVAAALTASLAIAGCASDDPAVDDLAAEPMSNANNAGAFASVPPELADQMEADISEEGGTVTNVTVNGGESGASVYRVTYVVDGQAKQAEYDRNGARLASLAPAPAAGESGQPAVGSAGDNSGPIEQRADQMGGGDGLGGGADVNNTGTVNAGDRSVTVDTEQTDNRGGFPAGSSDSNVDADGQLIVPSNTAD